MPRICGGTDTSQVITDPGIRSINIFYQCFHKCKYTSIGNILETFAVYLLTILYFCLHAKKLNISGFFDSV